MPEMSAAVPSTTLTAQIERQKTNTASEQQIRRQLFDIPKSPVAKATVQNLHDSEEQFLRSVLQRPGVNQRQAYDEQIAHLADVMGETIVEGSDLLTPLKGKPAIIVANHFGSNKFTFIDNQETNGQRPLDYPLDEVPTFAVRGAMYERVAQALGSPLRDTGVEFPGIMGQAQRDCGVIIIPVTGEGRTKRLTQDINQAVAEDGNPVIAIYPEGGTSGKESGMGPYHLENFSTGAFVVAAQTGLPIIPTCVVFNGETGQFELYVLPPVRLTPEDLQIDGKVGQVTEETRTKMQEAIDRATGQKN